MKKYERTPPARDLPSPSNISSRDSSQASTSRKASKASSPDTSQVPSLCSSTEDLSQGPPQDRSSSPEQEKPVPLRLPTALTPSQREQLLLHYNVPSKDKQYPSSSSELDPQEQLDLEDLMGDNKEQQQAQGSTLKSWTTFASLVSDRPQAPLPGTVKSILKSPKPQQQDEENSESTSTEGSEEYPGCIRDPKYSPDSPPPSPVEISSNSSPDSDCYIVRSEESEGEDTIPLVRPYDPEDPPLLQELARNAPWNKHLPAMEIYEPTRAQVVKPMPANTEMWEVTRRTQPTIVRPVVRKARVTTPPEVKQQQHQEAPKATTSMIRADPVHHPEVADNEPLFRVPKVPAKAVKQSKARRPNSLPLLARDQAPSANPLGGAPLSSGLPCPLEPTVLVTYGPGVTSTTSTATVSKPTSSPKPKAKWLERKQAMQLTIKLPPSLIGPGKPLSGPVKALLGLGGAPVRARTLQGQVLYRSPGFQDSPSGPFTTRSPPSNSSPAASERRSTREPRSPQDPWSSKEEPRSPTGPQGGADSSQQ